jgi:hypothetical protein
MGGLFRSLSLALALAATGGFARAACVMQELGELPVRVVDSQVMIDAEFNGQPATMLADTGAATTLLTRPGAKRLNLSFVFIPGAIFYGVGGADTGGMTHIKEFKVGNMTTKDLHVFVTGRNDMGAAGLLGADFLLQSDVEFDLPDNKIRFFEPQGCKDDQVVYWGKAYSVAPMINDTRKEVVVKISLNGQTLTALMDTGSGFSGVTKGGALKAGVTADSQGVVEAGPVVGMGPVKEQAYNTVFPTFSFGDETIKNAKLEFSDYFRADTGVATGSNLAAPSIDAPQMLLGADFFRSHRIYIARSQKKVYVSYMGGPVFDLPEKMPTAPPPATPPPK